MRFELEIATVINIDDCDAREQGHLLSGKLLHVQYDASASDTVLTEVGHLSAYRIFGEADELFYWADNASQDLHFAVEWLRRQEGGLPETALARGCLYLSDVWIEPAWRGQGLALKAVAAFLKVVGRNHFVFLRPSLGCLLCWNSGAKVHAPSGASAKSVILTPLGLSEMTLNLIPNCA